MNSRFEVSALPDGHAVIDIVGEVDMESAPELQSLIEDRLSSGRSVAVSFERCSYLDSSVINVLVRALRTANVHHLEIVLVCSTQSRARRVFDVAGLRNVMPVVESIDQIAVSKDG